MASAPDAVDLLVAQHREVEELFGTMEGLQVRALSEPDGLRDERNRLKNTIVEQLSKHAAVEELHFYPRIREALGDGDALAGRAYEEQQHVKELLHKLDGMSPEATDFDPTLRAVIAEVRRHVAFEEKVVFPPICDALPAATLAEIGRAMADAMPKAPTHPHPATPVSRVTAVAGGLMDKARDALDNRQTLD